MAQTITAVQQPGVEHGVLIDLTLPDPTTGAATLYRISNCYTDVVYNSNTYTALGGFLNVTDIQSDLQKTNNDITLSLSAIPSEYIEAILKHEIKGGTLRIYRAFFDSTAQTVLTNQVFLRFDGYITNYAVQEDVSSQEVTHTITVTASSILGVLDQRVSGRRTNEQSYQRYFAEQNITGSIVNDPSMSRVVILKAASFDFGKKP